MVKAFSDHFSAVSAGYAEYRPTYPASLFDWLAAIAPGHSLVWDCGTGSGQAAADLAECFDRVVATDASAAQIAAAVPHPRIEYRVAVAHDSGLADASVDLVTVAQALHWFDLEAFYAEVRRVLKPGGVLAAWSYDLLTIEGKAVDALLQAFFRGPVADYWPPERVHVRTGYRDLPFPLPELAAPAFTMTASWTLASLIGYLRTWSATARFIKQNGVDPTVALEAELAPLWGPPGRPRTVAWPLTVRAWRRPAR